MSLNVALSLFLDEYPNAIKRQLKGDAVANFVRNDVPEVLKQVIGSDPRYIVHGSVGQGNWARTPWIAIFDRLITESAQEGYYVVYLVREDFAGVYLSLNQGVMNIRKQYGSEAKTALRVRSADFVARLGGAAKGLHFGDIDLVASKGSNLSAYYEAGNICSLYYSKEEFPNDKQLHADLRLFIELYYVLASRESDLFQRVDDEDDVALGEEDLRVMRLHKQLERNANLAHRAKIAQGYICKACGFDFQVKYGEIGREFIEAHHLTPLSELMGQKLMLDPIKDFAVLCSNCHRMIHRTSFVNNVEDFCKNHIRQNNS